MGRELHSEPKVGTTTDRAVKMVGPPTGPLKMDPKIRNHKPDPWSGGLGGGVKGARSTIITCSHGT